MLHRPYLVEMKYRDLNDLILSFFSFFRTKLEAEGLATGVLYLAVLSFAELV